MTAQELELLLYKVRTWSGIALLFLITLQVVTGYMLAGKVSFGALDYGLIFSLHTKFSWIFIYVAATHAAVNLRFLFRRWWPKKEKTLLPILVGSYILITLLTAYLQFFK